MNLTLDKDYFITALDNQSTLYISIDQGTNVTYTITIYDRTGNEYVLLHDSNNTDVPGEHNGRCWSGLLSDAVESVAEIRTLHSCLYF